MMSRSDQGSITPYAIIFISVLMLFIGLSVDGGAKLRAGWEAVGIAEEAARAGAGLMDRAAIYRGAAATVDRGAAVRAAQAYLSASGRHGSAGIAGPQSIRVSVTVRKPTWLLSLVGISSVSMTATATADLVTGVEGPGRCAATALAILAATTVGFPVLMLIVAGSPFQITSPASRRSQAR